MSATGVPALTRVRIATRGSALALRQTDLIAAALHEHWRGLAIELVTVRTVGDTNQAAPIPALGDGVFVRGVEAEILSGHADVAVHSAKDIPSGEQPGLVLAAFPTRSDPRDVLVSSDGATFMSLRPGARLGTGSPRRAAIARSLRPDLDVALIRGNVDTRLRKLRAGEYDAIVLAAAGLARLGMLDLVSEYLDPTRWVPPPGQGVLAVQCRSDAALQQLLAPLDDVATRVAITAERAVLARLGSGCRTPVGAHARLQSDGLALHGVLLSPDGAHTVAASLLGKPADAQMLGTALAERLIKDAPFYERG